MAGTHTQTPAAEGHAYTSRPQRRPARSESFFSSLVPVCDAGSRRWFDPLPLEATADGEPSVPLDAHARLASPRSNAGAAMLRRSYNYNNGFAVEGSRDAGLLFLSYEQDPRRQFVPVQRKLADADALSAFTRHVGSAVFAITPGARPGGFIADALFEQPP